MNMINYFLNLIIVDIFHLNLKISKKNSLKYSITFSIKHHDEIYFKN